MILARKSGWLIGVKVLRETPKAIIVKTWDDETVIRIRKSDTTQKLFSEADVAQRWIAGDITK